MTIHYVKQPGYNEPRLSGYNEQIEPVPGCYS